MSRYDAVVIGGGPNGLAAAAVLAQAGRKTALCESGPAFGGLSAGHEFHPGYTAPGLHHDTTQLRPFVMEALGLKDHGLEFGASEDLWVLDSRGDALHLTEDGEHLSDADRRGYLDWKAFVGKAGPVLTRVLDAPPLDVIETARGDWAPLLGPGLALRRLGGDFMLELFRVPPMCAADWVSEYMTDERLRAALAYDGVIRTFGGPWSPGTAADLLIHRALRGPSVRGGAHAVARALEDTARKAGAELLAKTRVERILTEGGRVTGVRTAVGDTLEAPLVLAACDPRVALSELLDPVAVPHAVRHEITHYRGEGIGAKIHLALNGPVPWRGLGDEAPARVRFMGSLDAIEQSFDPVKYGAFARRPVLDVYVPTVEDPSLAPRGHAVVSVWVHGAPYALENGWSSESRRALLQAALDVMAQAAPGLQDAVVASEVLAPVDIEARHGAPRGHIFHGDHALDQLLLRPIPQCAAYGTFVKGLRLGGSGSFPGGGLTGAPGVLSARQAL